MIKLRNALAAGTTVAFALLVPATTQAQSVGDATEAKTTSATSAFADPDDGIGDGFGGGTNPGGGGSSRNN